MIQSMTAFTRVQNQGDWGSAVCEIRSINHRYLELSIRLPENLHALEVLMRERLRHHLARGKIECQLRYQSGDGTTKEMLINTDVVKQLSVAHDSIAHFIRNAAPINTLEILHWPGVLQIPEINLETIQQEVLNLLEKALYDLVEARHREGKELQTVCMQRLDAMKQELEKVRKRLPDILAAQRERLMTRLKEINVELDPNRLEQEIVMIAQKIDVAEELERLETHINEVIRVLKQGGAVGRRLDFLMQELNREANTLGSKSIDAETTRASVELKVLIEQVREQIQNIE